MLFRLYTQFHLISVQSATYFDFETRTFSCNANFIKVSFTRVVAHSLLNWYTEFFGQNVNPVLSDERAIEYNASHNFSTEQNRAQRNQRMQLSDETDV